MVQKRPTRRAAAGVSKAVEMVKGQGMISPKRKLRVLRQNDDSEREDEAAAAAAALAEFVEQSSASDYGRITLKFELVSKVFLHTDIVFHVYKF